MINVVLPAYDEERVIGTLLRSLHQELGGRGLEYRAILVDDGSTDRTVEEARRVVDETGGALPLVVLRHIDNRGLGAALRTGIDWCLSNGTDDDVVVTLDADNTHPPALIPGLVAALDRGADIAIASRYRAGSRVVGVPRDRLFLSEIARRVMQLTFPIAGVRDYTCCFRAIPLRTLRRARRVYGDELATARGFEAVMDLLLRLRQLGITGTEIPLELDYRGRVGRSKMRVFVTIRRTLWLLVRRFVERFTVWSPARVRARLAGSDPDRLAPEAVGSSVGGAPR